jgi:RNA polymerase sigma-70 factor, ECF subfamily
VQDTKIIERIKAGDTEAFALLVEKYHRQLLSFIYHLVRDRNITEDIGQEVFFSIYKALPDFDENRGTPFSAWLFICARNQAQSALRKRKCRYFLSEQPADEPVDMRPSALQSLIAAEEKRALQHCLGQLAEPYRSTIIGSIQGHSVQNIADLTAVSTGTVKSRLFRAKQRLTFLVKEYFGGYGHE